MYSFEQYYSIHESVQISIDQIENLKDDKLFVTVGGGVGSGKTFLAKKFITLPVRTMTESIGGDESFIHMGTNSNVNSTKQRLQEAKENGFTTVLVLIDTHPDIVAEQIELESNLIEMERIVQSRDDALNVFETLKKDNTLVDFYVHNKR